MTLEAVQYFYPNIMGRVLLNAVLGELGDRQVDALLRQARLEHLLADLPPWDHQPAFAFSWVSGLMQALEALYGRPGGRGLALRIGKAAFRNGLRHFDRAVGVTDGMFRFLPLADKMETGAQLLARFFNSYTDQRVQVHTLPDRLIWQIDRCPVCWGRQAESPVCHLAVGVLQEGLYWLSGGKFFPVQETHCIAQGDNACTIEISRQPLG